MWSIELNHPSFPAPVRAVNDVQDHALPLEDSAPVDPGQTVPFTAIPFDTPWFEQQDGQVSSINVRIDNIGREVMPHLDQAVTVDAALQVTFRCHMWSAADGSATTAMDPIVLDLRQVTVNESYVQGTASPGDLANLQFLRVIYDIENYPALSQ